MGKRVHKPTTLLDRSQEFVQLARAMHKESPIYNRFAFIGDQGGVEAVYERVLTSQYIGFMLIDDETNKAVGFIVGYTERSLFCELTVAYEMFWYIHPEHRTYRHMKLLIDAFENAAKEEGADMVALSTTSGIRPGNTAKLYQKLGYELIGVAAMKEVNHGT